MTATLCLCETNNKLSDGDGMRKRVDRMHYIDLLDNTKRGGPHSNLERRRKDSAIHNSRDITF